MGIRCKVKVGYSFIGPGGLAYPEGSVFEDLKEEQIQDQMWKLEILPSRAAGEAEGYVDKDTKPLTDEEERKVAQEAFNKENDSESEDEKEEDFFETDEEEAAAAEGDESLGDEDEKEESEDESEHKHDCCDEDEKEAEEAEEAAEKPKKRKKRG